MPTSEIGILIPTVNRADKLAALVENIHAATETPHAVYLIAEADDLATMKATVGLRCHVLPGTFGSFGVAANHGYRTTTEPFVIAGNDDLKFHPGWDTKALERMSDSIHIVGLNDGSGDCKCFQLVRRSYIEAESGVFDQPNALYHTYRHLCCDTEFAFYAMLRGVWANAPDALVEHEHWRFGKADVAHPNYQRALASETADLEEYACRREQWDPDGKMPMAVPGR